MVKFKSLPTFSNQQIALVIWKGLEVQKTLTYKLTRFVQTAFTRNFIFDNFKMKLKLFD